MLRRHVGRLEAIHIAAGAGAPMRPLAQAEAISGAGLTGDRYAAQLGFYSARPTEPGAREVTLFEAETLDQLAAEHQIALRAGQHRRNLTTRGVRLDELIGQRFTIGHVVLEGVKDCPPCEHLQQLVGKPVLQPLLGHGGLRARVVQGGTIRVGDPIARISASTPAAV
jgi:MOSC domain-containing protein YiiM